MPHRTGLIQRIQYDSSSGCWNWKGARDNLGRGKVRFNGATVLVSRLSVHLWLRMNLADPRCVCHRCDNPSCFNPKHLFVGTQADNMRDKILKFRDHNQKKTHCQRGHAYDDKNTYRRYGGGRVCRACDNERTKRLRRDPVTGGKFRERHRLWEQNRRRESQ